MSYRMDVSSDGMVRIFIAGIEVLPDGPEETEYWEIAEEQEKINKRFQTFIENLQNSTKGE